MTTSTEVSQSFASTWFATARDALMLKPEPYERLGHGKASIRQGVAIVAVVGLIIGVVAAVVALPGLFRSPAAAVDDFFNGITQALNQFRAFGGQTSPELQQFLDIYKRSMESFRPFVDQIMAIRAPLPPFFERFFAWVGVLITRPFALLAGWLSISIWIMLFARLLGGRGGLVHYLNASALSVIPHLLGVLAFIPCIGGLLALVGSIWGLAMQYKAVQVTHGLSQGRAIAAVLLPYILFVLLIGLIASLVALGIFAMVSSLGNQGPSQL